MPETTAPELPALAIARDLLAHEQYPAPEDCLPDLDPITALFYVEQWGYALLAMWAGFLSEERDDDGEDDGQRAQVLTAIGEACGMLDAACATMGVLPPEAADK